MFSEIKLLNSLLVAYSIETCKRGWRQPDDYDQKYLNCSVSDPVLQVEQAVYLENGRPIEYSRSRNRFDTKGYSLLDVKNI